ASETEPPTVRTPPDASRGAHAHCAARGLPPGGSSRGGPSSPWEIHSAWLRDRCGPAIPLSRTISTAACPSCGLSIARIRPRNLTLHYPRAPSTPTSERTAAYVPDTSWLW